MKSYDHEEEFHAKDRKQFRKERKLAQKTDRSKFKKTDQPALKRNPDALPHVRKGRIIAITGEGAWVDSEGETLLCSLKGLFKKETQKSKNLIAVGDWVRLGEGASIDLIETRTSFLSRTDISGRKEQLIAVNVDQAIITVSLINPPLKSALVDRYLIALEKGGIHPIIAVNKIDLLTYASTEEKELYYAFLAAYEPLGYPILSLSTVTGAGLEALRSLLLGKTSVFSGQSGVGKSSLLNACFDLTQKVGDLAVKTSKGAHTTTSASLIPLPDGGYCVDTPGIRSFGIWSLTKQDVVSHFRDIAAFSPQCKYPDCLHLHEPDCAVEEALEQGKIAPLRYESYAVLLDEIDHGPKNKTWS